jgi:secreted trypsin-like serine protease
VSRLFTFISYCGTKNDLFAAAHCFEFYKTRFALADYHAMLGRHNLSNTNERNWHKRSFSSIVIHDEYNESAQFSRSNADVAVMRMTEKVAFSDFIRPVCLPPPRANPTNLHGTVVGYGYNYDRVVEVTPKQADLHTINYAKCLLKHPNYGYIVSERSFCGGDSKAAPCNGDSGGGFFVKDNSGRYVTYGIVSQGFNKYDCSPKDYVVFVDVAAFVGWIREGELI